MCNLYRGVSVEYHTKKAGRLIPAGVNSEVLMTRNDMSEGVVIPRDGTFVRYTSATNAIRAHQLKSGFHDSCYISTTKDIERAKFFATIGGAVDGYIYIIDTSKFSDAGVMACELPDPHYPDEQEVTLRALDNGEIPIEVIIQILPVNAGEYVA